MTVPTPQASVRYFDKDGKLTPEGLQFFLQLTNTLRATEEKVNNAHP